MREYIEPSPEFDWSRVTWAASDVPVSDAEERCSYCGQLIPEDHVPLRLWNDEGWEVQFCDSCRVQYWGFAPREREEMML